MINGILKVAGEEEPFLQCSKVTYQRLGEVIVKYGVKVLSSHALGDTSDRATSLTLLLEIPGEYVSQVALHLRTKLSEPIQADVPYRRKCDDC